MEKTASFSYGAVVLPADRQLRDFYVDLIRNDGVRVLERRADYPAASVALEVPNGFGWKVRVTNYNSHAEVIGDPVFSDPFDAITPVNIVIAVSVE